MKKQVLLIHGGNSFPTYEDYLFDLRNMSFDMDRINSSRNRWNRNLDELLGDEFEVIMPQMPCKQNAKYLEWKIYFEKIIPFLRDGVILIGHSLGGIFLAKYLSENIFPVKIVVVYLVSAPFDDSERNDIGYSLGDFSLPESLNELQNQVKKIFIFHSNDDLVVPIIDAHKYSEALPEAELLIFEDKGHFMHDNFAELVKAIRKLSN